MGIILFWVLELIFCQSNASENETVDLNDKIFMNNCTSSEISFKNADITRIGINNHCGMKRKVYEVIGAGSENVNGIFEPYGINADTTKYEKHIDDGTIFRIQKDDKTKNWFIIRADLTLMYIAPIDRNSDKFPPFQGWKSVRGSNPPPTLKYHNLKKIRTQKLVYDLDDMIDEVEVDNLGSNRVYSSSSEAKVLKQMLHPAVGPGLGKYLRKFYKNAAPVESITLDNLLDDNLLRKAITFKDVSLDDWVGPESGLGCCKYKYRLNFEHWRTNKWAKALQSLIADRLFIRFLEEMTGIFNLVPVKVQDDRFVQLGSSVIAVARDGYLDIHNDFNIFHDVIPLYRRINVLFYLNEEWEESWQGHLELWNANLTRCVTRIPPLFNRMAIFTVTDDAYHGHPEPLQCPKDKLRYALQLVYYTREKGPTHSNSPGPKRMYNGSHSAIFQPYCASNPQLKKFCANCKRDFDYGDKRCCECNYNR